MQFMLIAGDAPGSTDRRLAVRPDHLARLDIAYRAGVFRGGGATLDDQGNMIGSVAFLEFETVAEAEAWVAADPYMIAGVWQTTELRPMRIWRPTASAPAAEPS